MHLCQQQLGSEAVFFIQTLPILPCWLKNQLIILWRMKAKGVVGPRVHPLLVKQLDERLDGFSWNSKVHSDSRMHSSDFRVRRSKSKKVWPHVHSCLFNRTSQECFDGIFLIHPSIFYTVNPVVGGLLSLGRRRGTPWTGWARQACSLFKD